MQFFGFLIFFLIFCPLARAFDSMDGEEAQFSYHGQVQIHQATRPKLEDLDQLASEQVWYLMGGLVQASTLGIPRSDQSITNISLRQDSVDSNLFYIEYDYTSTVLFKKGVGDAVNFPLPLNPFTVFQAAAPKGRNRCVSNEYNTEYYFFYFWNPKLKGCALRENIDYKYFTGNVKKNPPRKNTTSFPEYSRLVQANGDLTINILTGSSTPGGARDPHQSSDAGAAASLNIQRELSKEGFKVRVWSDDEIRTYAPIPLTALPYIQEYSKDVSLAGQAKRILIRLYFGDTGLKEHSEVFQYLLKDSFEKASVLIYAGHSGLGSSVGISDVERTRGFQIKPALDRYQIYFFHSCSSYFYYNEYFRELKISPLDPNGTKNLDILTNGITTFDHGADNSIPLLRAINDWATGVKTWSYQSILKAGTSNDLFSVTGDEDNSL